MNQRIRKSFNERTAEPARKIKDAIRRDYGIEVKGELKLDALQIGETNKIRVHPVAHAARDMLDGSDIEIVITLSDDGRNVEVRDLTQRLK